MIKLGDRVKDRITGFSGIVIARSEYLNGCRRFGVQPEAAKDNVPAADVWLDESQLTLVKAGVHIAIPIPEPDVATPEPYRGGPARSGDRGA